MTNRILALVDGSTYSESVCHHAAWAASRLGAGVDLLHVLGRREAPTGDLSGALHLGARTALLDELVGFDRARARRAQTEGRALLEDAQRIVERTSTGPVNQRLWQGDLLNVVAEFAVDIRALVIGKCGKAADVLPGHSSSNVERISREMRLPILVVPRVFQPITRVIVAFNGSASTERAIERMVGNPVFAGLDVVLVHAGTESPTMRKRLDHAVQRLGMSGIAARGEFNPGGDPEGVLQRKVENEGFDLSVMGAYGHSRIRSLMVGSTTTAMLQASRVPVLLYR